MYKNQREFYEMASDKLNKFIQRDASDVDGEFSVSKTEN